MKRIYPFTITDPVRDNAGHWTALITIYGDTHAVDRSQGSWRYTPSDSRVWRELEPRYAAALQERVRRFERAAVRADVVRGSSVVEVSGGPDMETR